MKSMASEMNPLDEHRHSGNAVQERLSSWTRLGNYLRGTKGDAFPLRTQKEVDALFYSQRSEDLTLLLAPVPGFEAHRAYLGEKAIRWFQPLAEQEEVNNTRVELIEVCGDRQAQLQSLLYALIIRDGKTNLTAQLAEARNIQQGLTPHFHQAIADAIRETRSKVQAYYQTRVDEFLDTLRPEECQQPL